VELSNSKTVGENIGERMVMVIFLMIISVISYWMLGRVKT